MVTILLSNRLGERKMMQSELAQKTGIRPSTISDYYHGFAKRIPLKHLELICKALNCDICDILTLDAERVAQAERAIRRAASAPTEADFVQRFDAEFQKQRKMAQTRAGGS